MEYRRALGYRQAQVLSYVRQVMADEGRAPSYQMICDELGFGGREHVHRIVKRLERRALLRRVGSGRVRRIRLR